MFSIPGSEMIELPGSTLIGPADPTQQIQVTFALRAKSTVPVGGHGVPPLSPTEFTNKYGVDPVVFDSLKHMYEGFGLSMVNAYPDRRTADFSGTVATVAQVFGVSFVDYEAEGVTYRGYVGPISIHDDFASSVITVLGLDNIPLGDPSSAHVAAGKKSHKQAASCSPQDLAKAYDFPSATGAGVCVGIIAFAGFAGTDIDTFFNGSPPKVTSDYSQGAIQTPFFETTCDIEMIGAIAPDAQIVVYVGVKDAAGWLKVVTKAIHDTKNGPSVLSISWSAREDLWPDATLTAMQQAFADCPALGITVFAAAGDASGGVDYPAADPCVLSCGGTNLSLAADGTIDTETAWDNTNGGVSTKITPAPEWQTNAGVPPSKYGAGRGVPDVAGSAEGIIECYFDGQQLLFGGTSAVAPLWAGLIARINPILGKPAGFISAQLYTQPKACCRDISSGSSSDYKAVKGWDPCTGWGSPNGSGLLQVLQGTVAKVSTKKPKTKKKS